MQTSTGKESEKLERNCFRSPDNERKQDQMKNKEAKRLAISGTGLASSALVLTIVGPRRLSLERVGPPEEAYLRRGENEEIYQLAT